MELPSMLEAYIGSLAVARCEGVEAVKGRHASLLQSGNVNFAIMV